MEGNFHRSNNSDRVRFNNLITVQFYKSKDIIGNKGLSNNN